VLLIVYVASSFDSHQMLEVAYFVSEMEEQLPQAGLFSIYVMVTT
jgi:hypothetical protein